MKIFTTKDLQHIFNKTAEHDSENGVGLMERTSSAVACEIITRWRPNKRFVLFAGPGHNGSISLGVAHDLMEQGYRLEVFLFNVPSMPMSEECQASRDRLLKLADVDFTEVTTQFEMPYLSADDVVIDGLFGTGLAEPLKGGFTTLVQYINSSGAYIVSIDTPSGLMGEWNDNNDRRNIVRANLTLTYQLKRLSFFFAENAEFIGECKVLDIELDREEIRKHPSNYFLVEMKDAKHRLKARGEFTHKYDYGTMLLAAGSYGMFGAAVLAAKAALRSGVGLLNVFTPRAGFAVLQNSVPEAVNEYDRDNLSLTDVRISRKYTSIAIGPGIGTKDVTINAVDSLMKNCRQPMVIDADALNCIAQRPSLLESIPPMSVLTPHAGEFDRIFGNHFSEESRLRKAIDVARRYSVVILLKGRYTMVVRPDKKVYINSTGTPALATPGSGDVLTGIIGGLAAQGYEMERSAAIGAFIHGMAGEKAEMLQGQYSVTASDIVAQIGPAIKEIMK